MPLLHSLCLPPRPAAFQLLHPLAPSNGFKMAHLAFRHVICNSVQQHNRHFACSLISMGASKNKKDRGSRPPKNALAPAPVMTAVPGTTGLETMAHCHTCGRIMSVPRPRPNKQSPTDSPTTPKKYCSDRCRRERPRPQPSTATIKTPERLIEDKFVTLLGSGTGDSRGRIVLCGEVERAIFGESRQENQNDAVSGKTQDESGDASSSSNSSDSSDGDEDEIEEEAEVGAEEKRQNPLNEKDETIHHDVGEDYDSDTEGGVKLSHSTIPQHDNHQNTFDQQQQQSWPASISDQPDDKRKQGLVRARRREMVRQAARRGVAFGFVVDETAAVAAAAVANGVDDADAGAARLAEQVHDEEEGSGRRKKGKKRSENGDELNLARTEGRYIAGSGRRKVEAVQGGRAVESSFAKGEWGVRWI